MYTQCPHCDTFFAIGAAQLEAADGTVRCGECGETFDAKQYLSEHLPDAASDATATPQAAGLTQDTIATPESVEPTPATAFADLPVATGLTAADIDGPETGVDLPESDLGLGEEPAPDTGIPPEAEFTTEGHGGYEEMPPESAVDAAASAPGPVVPDEFIPEPAPPPSYGEDFAPSAGPTTATAIDTQEKAADQAPPRLARNPEEILELDELGLRQRPAPGWFATSLWTTAILILLAALAIQYAYFFRDELGRYSSVRPWLERLCVLAKCEVALREDPSLLEFASRDVRTHPEVPHALLINAVFVNTAPFPQPYPPLRFRLTNLNGTTVASRSFRPTEYLDEETNIAKGLMPNTPVHVKLEIKDPGEQAVSYEFDFH